MCCYYCLVRSAVRPAAPISEPKLLPNMKNVLMRILYFWLPGWEHWSGAQRAACVDFGLSFSAAMVFGCADSMLLCLLGAINLLRSWHRLKKSGVKIDE